jgi:phosphate starvation-inducible PhoH-like protein
MSKKIKSNLPANVLPTNQFFDNDTSQLSLDIYDPLHIERDSYVSPKEKKRQEKLMKRHNRRQTRRNKHNDAQRPSKYAEKTKHPSNNDIVIVPRTDKQAEYLAALNDESIHLVFASGPAGTGKSYLATKWAIQQFKSGAIDKIVITRPNVAVDDNDLGFLPGDILEKLSPWIKPITDIMLETFSKSELEYFLKEEKVEICPICYIRGRTFKNSIVIVDEAQGTTQNSMLAVLTRIGEGSKILITGDTDQKDKRADGLGDFIERYKKNNIAGVALIEFEKKDVQRHPIISEILKLYEK